MSAGTERLFIGLPVPEDVARRLAGDVAEALDGVDGARVYDGADLHLTLAFLGDLDGDAARRVVAGLADEARGVTAPELELDGIGAFPSRSRARVVWAGAREVPGTEGRLAAVRNRAVQAALQIGWRPPRAERGRPFRPHVTVARLRHAGRAFERLADLPVRGGWVASDVVVFRTARERGGPRYAVEATTPLAVRPG